MCCCHGHGHLHHGRFGYSPGYEYGPPPVPPYARRGRRTARETSKITFRILKTSWPGSAGTCRSYGRKARRPGKLRAHGPGGGMSPGAPGGREAPASRPVAAVLSAAGTGPRRTRQRSVIIALLNEVSRFPHCAGSLPAARRAEREKAGLATVYRTLHALVRAGEVDTARTARGVPALRPRASPSPYLPPLRPRGRDHQPGPETVDRADCRRQRLPRHRP